MDASLSDKLIALDPEANAEKVKVIKAEVIGSSDWNPQMTAKTMNCGESICHWLSAICNFVEKKEVSFFSVNNFRWFFPPLFSVTLMFFFRTSEPVPKLLIF